MMRKVVATVSVTLDGVMQAPGRADEDTRGGFAHGGWAAPYADRVMMETMGKGMAQAGPLLFGRRTYEDFQGVWAGRDDNPFSAVLDNAPKFVATRTLDTLSWGNSTRLDGEAERAVEKLKGETGPDIGILGSGDLLRSLMRVGLVDTLVLLIHPLLLGTGRRLFDDQASRVSLRLSDSVTTTTGVVIATYHLEREGAEA
jgi:dihydrofolate reductase